VRDAIGLVKSSLQSVRIDGYAAAVAALTSVFHIVTAPGYGVFRDELYYLASANHLDFGYVEHPPLIAVVAWVTRTLLGESLHAVRFLPSVAAGVTVWLSAAISRELGGGRYAQLLTAIAVVTAPVYMSLFTVLSMNAFDVMFWTLAVLVFVRILAGGAGRLWMLFGVVVGIAMQNKISMLFLAFGVCVSLLITRSWTHLSSRWSWIGGAFALLIFLPHIIWQIAHGWPTLEFIQRASELKNIAYAPIDFLTGQVLHMNPFSIGLWGTGLVVLLFSPWSRRFRAVGLVYLIVLAVMLTQNAKPYYLSPAYPMLLAAGAVAIERVTALRWKWVRPSYASLLLVTGLLLAPFGKPLLPVDTYVKYANALGIGPSTSEQQELGRLPQFFADMHGWPELAAAVHSAFIALSPEEQKVARVFGQNYGEAGAVDVLGRQYGLPRAISGHNSYFLWGPGDWNGEVLIVIGGRREILEEHFEYVEQATVFTCTDCMPYENNRPIWICRRLRHSVADVWPMVKNFI
jgi:hypothetical protein